MNKDKEKGRARLQKMDPGPDGSLRFRLTRRCPRPSAAGAVAFPRGGDPVVLIYRPAAVGLLHLGLGYMHPTEPVSLADIHLWRYLFVVLAIYSPVLSSLQIDDAGGLGNYYPHQKKGRGGYTPAP